MNLYHGDCLEVLPTFPPASVEAIITDLPYGTTSCEWDSVIPLSLMWEQVKRVLKVNGVFITTASQPFTSVLVCSNLEWFKYEWMWDKRMVTGTANVEYMPMKAHETIQVFCSGKTTYNPQFTPDDTVKLFGKPGISNSEIIGVNTVMAKRNVGYPKTILKFPRPNNISGDGGHHPTQKPVKLYEYLIRTYTNAGETVLDICMGSGTTGVAAVQTGRNFIGIEKEQKYFEIASRRIAQAPQPLFTEPPRQPTQREPDLKLESGKLSGFE